MMNSRVNQTIKFQTYEPEGVKTEKNKGKPIQAKDSCNCPDGPAPHDEGAAAAQKR